MAHLEILAESLGAMVHLRHITDRLHASEQQYRMLFNEHPHPMWVYDKQTLELQAVNQSMVLHYGYSEAELLGMRMTDLWPEERREAIKAAIDAIDMNRRSRPVISRHVTKAGEFVDMEITAGSISFNGRPARQVLATDVTERLRTEGELARMSRAHRLLSACNEALVRATSEAALLRAICKIAVDIGGYRMGWVGFALDDEQKRIEPVAHGGYNPDYLEKLRLSWSEDHPFGRGPAGMAIRSGKPVIVQDIRRGEHFGDWTERMLQHGFHGVICLPLRDRDRSFGIFYLYAPEILHISAEEATLLQQVSDLPLVALASQRPSRQWTEEARQRLMSEVAHRWQVMQGTLDCEPLVYEARPQGGGSVMLMAGQDAGLRPGDRLVLVDARHVPRRLLGKSAQNSKASWNGHSRGLLSAPHAGTPRCLWRRRAASVVAGVRV
jgi:PAS domain S-box-containing protein